MDKNFVPFYSVHIDHFPVKVQVENLHKVLMHVVATTAPRFCVKAEKR
jgi:hypothetical protein